MYIFSTESENFLSCMSMYPNTAEIRLCSHIYFTDNTIRISGMEKILCGEQYLMENHCSDTGFLEISKFLKTNTSDASPLTIFWMERCKQYLSHHQWMKTNFLKLKRKIVLLTTMGKSKIIFGFKTFMKYTLMNLL